MVDLIKFLINDQPDCANFLIEEFCNKISENIGNELTDILTPNFTTSTKESIIAGKVSIMSTFKKYNQFRNFSKFW